MGSFGRASRTVNDSVEEMIRAKLEDSRRIVVKVGTSSLTLPGGGLDLEYMGDLVAQLAQVAGDSREVMLVSSGAVGAGIARLGLPSRPGSIPQRQAAAAVGQGILVQAYEDLFSRFGLDVGQVLLTREDLVHRHRYINSRNTLSTLLDFGVIPVVNENDTVATEEIEFGDNDNLSALVAGLVNADLLVNLTDIDGLYDGDPRSDPRARLLSFVPEVTPGLRAAAQSPGSSLGSGGMKTKLQAAAICAGCGVHMVIARANEPSILPRILGGERLGTLFPAASHPMEARKRWIAFGADPAGAVVVDGGARDAIVDRGASLLPSGVIDVEGEFGPGQSIRILDEARGEFARGLARYSSGEVAAIMGAQTHMIEEILGELRDPEVVDRDDLVLM